MNITQKSPSRNRPGVIMVLAILIALQGIDNLGIGIWMAITGRPLSYFGSIPISAIYYPLLLIHSSQASIVLSILAGIFFFVLAWGLITLKLWAYWVTLIVVLPSWMVYDLSKTLLLFFHTLPPTLFENPDISSNAVPFIIELVAFIFLLRKKVRNSFYLPELNVEREEVRTRR